MDNSGNPPNAIPDGGSFNLLSLPGGIGSVVTLTFQGLIQDPCTIGTQPYSVTNGILVQFQ